MALLLGDPHQRVERPHAGGIHELELAEIEQDRPVGEQRGDPAAELGRDREVELSTGDDTRAAAVRRMDVEREAGNHDAKGTPSGSSPRCAGTDPGQAMSVRPQAHVASGLLVWSLSDAPMREAPLDVLAANLPDLDRTIAKRLGVEGRRHHVWPSHSALLWALPTLAALRTDVATRPMGLVWLHLVLDTYADGIVWLWPVHKEKIGLFRKPPEIHDDGWNTPAPLGSELGKIELAMWAVTAVSVLRRLAGSGAGRARSSRSRRRRPRLAVR